MSDTTRETVDYYERAEMLRARLEQSACHPSSHRSRRRRQQRKRINDMATSNDGSVEWMSSTDTSPSSSRDDTASSSSSWTDAESDSTSAEPRQAVQRAINMIKTVLLGRYVKTGSTIIDLGCGRGHDVAKMAYLCPSRVIFIDAAEKPLIEAERRWRRVHRPFAAAFVRDDFCSPRMLAGRRIDFYDVDPDRAPGDQRTTVRSGVLDTADTADNQPCDACSRGVGEEAPHSQRPGGPDLRPGWSTRARQAPCSVDPAAPSDDDEGRRCECSAAKDGRFVAADSVSCQMAMHHAFSSRRSARTFVANVARIIRPGGTFICIVPDAETILQAANAHAATSRDARKDTDAPSGSSSPLPPKGSSPLLFQRDAVCRQVQSRSLSSSSSHPVHSNGATPSHGESDHRSSHRSSQQADARSPSPGAAWKNHHFTVVRLDVRLGNAVTALSDDRRDAESRDASNRHAPTNDRGTLFASHIPYRFRWVDARGEPNGNGEIQGAGASPSTERLLRGASSMLGATSDGASIGAQTPAVPSCPQYTVASQDVRALFADAGFVPLLEVNLLDLYDIESLNPRNVSVLERMRAPRTLDQPADRHLASAYRAFVFVSVVGMNLGRVRFSPLVCSQPEDARLDPFHPFHPFHPSQSSSSSVAAAAAAAVTGDLSQTLSRRRRRSRRGNEPPTTKTTVARVVWTSESSRQTTPFVCATTHHTPPQPPEGVHHGRSLSRFSKHADGTECNSNKDNDVGQAGQAGHAKE